MVEAVRYPVALFVRASTLLSTCTSKTGNYRDTIGFSLYWTESIFPGLKDLFHWGRRGWEIFLLAVGMQHGIVMCKECVLDAYLSRKQVWEKRKCHRDKLREMIANMVIGSIVVLCMS